MPFPKNREIEALNNPKIVEILEKNGFEDIKSAEKRRFSPFDFRAFRNGKLCFIEARVRSSQAKSQFFTFTDSKLRHLAELEREGDVYIILLNKFGHRILTLNELLSGKHEDIHFFKYKNREAYYWTKNRWGKDASTKKTERIVIKCDVETKNQFRGFAIKFKDQEAALNALLDLSEGKGYVLRT